MSIPYDKIFEPYCCHYDFYTRSSLDEFKKYVYERRVYDLFTVRYPCETCHRCRCYDCKVDDEKFLIMVNHASSSVIFDVSRSHDWSNPIEYKMYFMFKRNLDDVQYFLNWFKQAFSKRKGLYKYIQECADKAIKELLHYDSEILNMITIDYVRDYYKI